MQVIIETYGTGNMIIIRGIIYIISQLYGNVRQLIISVSHP